MNSINITTLESLNLAARRRGIGVHGAVPPTFIIPLVEAAIDDHKKRDHGTYELSGDYIEWKAILDDLEQFLALLRSLPAKLPREYELKKASPPAPTHREKIEKLNQDIQEGLSRLPTALQQELATVAPPLQQPLHPRQSPVADPLPNASDALPNASTKPPHPEETLAPGGESKAARDQADYLAQLLSESTAAKSPIDDFPPERQQALYQLTQDVPLTVLARMLAAPEPLGWNFKTTHASLRRFKERYQKKLEAAETAAALENARTVAQQPGADEQTYIDATRRLLKIRLYKNAADPKGSDDEIEFLMRLLDRQRRTDLAERRVRVAEQRANT